MAGNSVDSVQLPLDLPEVLPAGKAEGGSAGWNGRANKLDAEDRAFHDWYRFVLSFPPHLVRSYLQDFALGSHHTVLDPFCGTGTTLVESRLQHVPSVGLEPNPLPHFASSVKLDWDLDPVQLESQTQEVAQAAYRILQAQGIRDNEPFYERHEDIELCTLDEEAQRLILANSISPLPLHKTLVLLSCLKQRREERWHNHAVLALANALVYKISNLHFGPEVGVRNIKTDAPVLAIWLNEVRKIAEDLRLVQGQLFPSATVHLADARALGNVIAPRSIDAVITSPPYPNEKDYTRTTRLESVLLGFVNSKTELKELKSRLIRSNTRGVYKGDDDDRWVAAHAEIQRIADDIERRRIELGKDSGFERQYARVTKLYFGGMARHLAELRGALRPGAHLAYVVGDQASYLRVMIRTGQLLADIAQALGYEVERIDLFRTRLATATREQLREEVVVLRWKGEAG